MLPRRILTGLILMLFLIQVTGCYTLRPLDREVPATWADGTDKRIIRLTTRQGESMELNQVSGDSVSIRGHLLWSSSEWSPENVVIPLSEIAVIEEKAFSWGKAMLIAGVGMGIVAVVMASAYGEAAGSIYIQGIG
jgi:hypothetical protein